MTTSATATRAPMLPQTTLTSFFFKNKKKTQKANKPSLATTAPFPTLIQACWYAIQRPLYQLTSYLQPTGSSQTKSKHNFPEQISVITLRKPPISCLFAINPCKIIHFTSFSHVELVIFQTGQYHKNPAVEINFTVNEIKLFTSFL